MSAFNIAFAFFRAFFRERLELAAENLPLRQQLAVQQRSAKRPVLRHRDRIFWVWLSRLWKDWPSALLIVKPDTVVRWHRQSARPGIPIRYGTQIPAARQRRDLRPAIPQEG